MRDVSILHLVFMPQMVAQCRDPKGEKVFSKNENKTPLTGKTLSSRGEKTKITTMEHDILSLKELLIEGKQSSY